jgi:hypothetical protein
MLARNLRRDLDSLCGTMRRTRAMDYTDRGNLRVVGLCRSPSLAVPSKVGATVSGLRKSRCKIHRIACSQGVSSQARGVCDSGRKPLWSGRAAPSSMTARRCPSVIRGNADLPVSRLKRECLWVSRGPCRWRNRQFVQSRAAGRHWLQPPNAESAGEWAPTGNGEMQSVPEVLSGQRETSCRHGPRSALRGVSDCRETLDQKGRFAQTDDDCVH